MEPGDGLEGQTGVGQAESDREDRVRHGKACAKAQG